MTLILKMAVVALLLFGCTEPRNNKPQQDILLIGDSVMSWNRSSGGDVGRQLEAKLRRSVTTMATPGARLRATGISGLGNLSIQNQLFSGTWNWVVINGGANDLGRNCGCTSCAGELELLMSSDGKSGIVPDIVRRAQGYGARVLWIGYYQAPQSRAFRGCRPALVELERRISNFAEKTPSFFFIDAEDFFDPEQQELYARDLTHPSTLGSALIARQVAEIIMDFPSN